MKKVFAILFGSGDGYHSIRWLWKYVLGAWKLQLQKDPHRHAPLFRLLDC